MRRSLESNMPFDTTPSRLAASDQRSILPLPRSALPTSSANTTNASGSSYTPFANVRVRRPFTLGNSIPRPSSAFTPTSTSWNGTPLDASKRNWFSSSGTPASKEFSLFGGSHIIEGVSKLKERCDKMPPETGDLGTLNRTLSANGLNEVFAFVFGSERWKLEVARKPSDRVSSEDLVTDPLLTTAHSKRSSVEEHSNLYLYLTCHLFDLEYANEDVQIETAVYISVEDAHQRPVSSKAQVYFEIRTVHTFAADAEYFCCPFPSLDTFLSKNSVREQDSFLIRIQLQSPAHHRCLKELDLDQSVALPKSIMTGLSGMIDHPNGDIRISLAERAQHMAVGPDDMGMYRKRFIYAHSSILMARSSYFHDMLDRDSDWKEQQQLADNSASSNKLGTLCDVKLLDCDYASFCWILRWLYTDEIIFQREDDPREPAVELPEHALDATGLGWSWQPMPLAEETSSPLASHMKQNVNIGLPPPSASLKKTFGRRRSITPTLSSPSRRVSASLNAGRVSPTSPTHNLNTLESALEGNVQSNSAEDPHIHPNKACWDRPASALAIFRISHRYALSDLTKLALEHIVQHLRPDTAFPLFLASHLYPDLTQAIREFIYSHYTEVTVSDEYRRCLVEITQGAWPDSAPLLLEFTRFLSPA